MFQEQNYHCSIFLAFMVTAETNCINGDKDTKWGLVWNTTLAGNRDSQPCPVVSGVQSAGFAFRRCGDNGEWEEEVDVSNCRSLAFDEIERNAVR